MKIAACRPGLEKGFNSALKIVLSESMVIMISVVVDVSPARRERERAHVMGTAELD